MRATKHLLLISLYLQEGIQPANGGTPVADLRSKLLGKAACAFHAAWALCMTPAALRERCRGLRPALVPDLGHQTHGTQMG